MAAGLAAVHTIVMTTDKIIKTTVAMDMIIVIQPISMQCEVEPVGPVEVVAAVMQALVAVAAMEIVTIHTIHTMMVILFDFLHQTVDFI